MPRQLDFLFVRREVERIVADESRPPLRAAVAELLRRYFRSILDQERSGRDGGREDPRRP